MRKLLLIPVILCAISFGPAVAQNKGTVYGTAFMIRGGNAEDLVSHCASVDQLDPETGAVPEKNTAELSFCFGYVLGVVDMHSLQSSTSSNASPYCLPDDASTSQLAKVVVKYGNDHPEVLNKPALFLLSNAFIQSFPCKPAGQ